MKSPGQEDPTRQEIAEPMGLERMLRTKGKHSSEKPAHHN